MLNSKQNSNEMSSEDVKKIANKAMYLGFGTLLIIFLSMTTCTMHSNSYDPDRIREQTALKTAEVDVERAKLANKEKELKIIERLVALGVNPIAARCGVHGWNTDRNGNPDTACVIAAGKDSIISIKKDED